MSASVHFRCCPHSFVYVGDAMADRNSTALTMIIKKKLVTSVLAACVDETTFFSTLRTTVASKNGFVNLTVDSLRQQWCFPLCR